MITLAIRDFILKTAEFDNEFAIELLKKTETQTTDKRLIEYMQGLSEYLSSRPISEGRSDVLPDPQG